MSQTESSPAPSSLASVGVPLRSSWAALSVLFLVYFFNNLDRSTLTILSQPIKEELGLADWQLGLMTGFAFSVLYLAVGFPMARLADRGNRSLLLSGCVLVWSVMTAICGLATTFVQLCLLRAAVGVGESGCLPTSHSLISDLFPPERRAKALALFGLGMPLGGLAGVTIGGYAMDQWGWRTAFVIIGLPGIVVALITWLVIKEPERGRFDRAAHEAAPLDRQTLKEVALALWRSPLARNVIIALTAAGLVGAPNGVFMGPYMIRKFELGYTELGIIIAATFMLGSAISTLGGGLLVDWAARFDRRWTMWIPAIGVALSAPMYVWAYAQETWLGLSVIMFFASIINSTYLAPCFAALHSTVAPSGRATASVIAQFTLSLIGGSLGPLAGGLAIDLIAARLFTRFSSQPFLEACPGGRAVEGAAAALDQACRAAVVDGTQIMLIGFLSCMIWPAWHFYLAARAIPPGKPVRGA
jgi:predicted MFS family arabinose efflux permease